VTAAVIAAALVLLPAVVLAQIVPAQPETPFSVVPPTGVVPPRAVTPPTVVNPAPPRATIPSVSGLPVPTRPADRLPKLLDLRLFGRLIEEWTDNFERSEDDPRSNLRSTIAPGVRLLVEDPTVTGALAYSLRVFHDTFTPDDIGTHHLFAADVGWQTTPRLRLAVGASYVQEDDPEAADRLDLRRGRDEFTRLNGSLAADYVLPSLTLRGYYRISRFDATDELTTTHAVGANVTRIIGRTNTLTGTYEYLTSTTEGDLGTGLALEETTDGHEVTGTYGRELTSTLTAGLMGGYAFRTQSTRAGDDNFSRWNVAIFGNYVVPGTILVQANIGVAQLMPSTGDPTLLLTTDSHLTYYLGPATIRLAAEHGFSETFGFGQNFGVVETTGVAGSLSYRLSPLWTATAFARWRQNEDAGQGGRIPGEKETTTRFGVQATYDILRWLTTTLEYTHIDTSSSVAGQSFVENRIRATLNASFD
jgi:hypothetical protein